MNWFPEYSIDQLKDLLAEQQERLQLLLIQEAAVSALYAPVELELDIRATQRKLDAIEAELHRRNQKVLPSIEYSVTAGTQSYTPTNPDTELNLEAQLAHEQERWRILQLKRAIFGPHMPKQIELELQATERRIAAIKLELDQRDQK